MLTNLFWLGAAFTASGSFLTALGLGLRDAWIEQPGVALVGAAVLSVLVALKRAIEDRRPARLSASRRARTAALLPQSRRDH